MKRRLLKALKYLGLALVALVVILAVAAVWLVRRPWPQTSGKLAVAGLTAPVQVIRDEWGVPQLYAANEHDLFFAQGYVHAQDRLWQMELGRHLSGGTLAELFGRPVVGADKGLRTYGLRRAAERDLAALSPGGRTILEAYAQGVNAYVDSHRGRLPLEFSILGVSPRPWTPADTLAWGKMIALSLGQNHVQETVRAGLAARVGEAAARQLMAPYPESGAVIVSPQAGHYGPGTTSGPSVHPLLAALLGPPVTARGSNNWVIHGSRTASGHPLLANDTHLFLNMPSAWYENGLHAGRFDVVGFSFPGVPLVLIGHNRRIAWGISNMCGDTQDLFVETMRGNQVQVDGRWQDAQLVREMIAVRGGKPETFDVVTTPDGPVINEAEELKGLPPLALRWTVAEPSRLIDSVAGYDAAGDWASFRQALSLWGAPTLNFVYADVDGHIGYQGAGLIPVRAPGQDGLAPVPPGAGRGWRGFLPFDQMPSLYDPPAGFIVTANNKTVADSYPHLIAHDYADPFRATRISQVLAANGKATLDDMKRLQADVYSLPAAGLRPYLLAAAGPADDRERRALELVRRWDLRFTTESAGATVYFTWFSHLLPDIVGDELGDDDLMKAYRPFGNTATVMYTEMMKDPRNPWFDDRRTKDRVETRDDIVRRAFREAVADLANRLGPDPAEWRWGRIHTALLGHQPFGDSGIAPLIKLFNGPAVPLPGEAFTVDAMTPNRDKPFRVAFGVSQRMIVDLGDLSRSLAVNSTGQDAQLFHRHRADQTGLWSRNEYHPMPFYRGAVEKAAAETLTLVPGR